MFCGCVRAPYVPVGFHCLYNDYEYAGVGKRKEHYGNLCFDYIGQYFGAGHFHPLFYFLFCFSGADAASGNASGQQRGL